MVPGIWLMPFAASTASRVFREHPDWFVRNEDGTGAKIADGWSPPPDHQWVCLDATIPEVREHLARIFKTFHQWGFRYFKLDGLGFALQQGLRRDPAATPVTAYRLGLEAIRNAVPDDFILGCCPCYLPSLGFFNSVRSSDDTAANWPALFHAWQGNVSRFWMYDRWYRCDPDALIARQDRGELTEAEARFSCLTGIITGISITSDNLKTIAPERVKYLRKGAEYRLAAPIPREWYPKHTWPFVFNGTVNGKNAAAIFNWSEEEVTFDLSEIGLPSAADELLQEVECTGKITLAPHDGALLVAK
jgi:alpha-galactosidase